MPAIGAPAVLPLFVLTVNVPLEEAGERARRPCGGYARESARVVTVTGGSSDNGKYGSAKGPNTSGGGGRA